MSPKEAWASGDAYERYVGRWSRPVASRFIDWLSVRGRARWLDVGCGTGALTQAIRAHAEPREVIGIDPSPDFIDHARRSIIDDLVRFRVGNAMSLPFEDGSFDAVVCGLVLNFIPNQPQALVEMYRVATAGAIVGSYVWDYAGRMEMMRYFWDAADALD